MNIKKLENIGKNIVVPDIPMVKLNLSNIFNTFNYAQSGFFEDSYSHGNPSEYRGYFNSPVKFSVKNKNVQNVIKKVEGYINEDNKNDNKLKFDNGFKNGEMQNQVHKSNDRYDVYIEYYSKPAIQLNEGGSSLKKYSKETLNNCDGGTLVFKIIDKKNIDEYTEKPKYKYIIVQDFNNENNKDKSEKYFFTNYVGDYFTDVEKEEYVEKVDLLPEKIGKIPMNFEKITIPKENITIKPVDSKLLSKDAYDDYIVSHNYVEKNNGKSEIKHIVKNVIIKSTGNQKYCYTGTLEYDHTTDSSFRHFGNGELRTDDFVYVGNFKNGKINGDGKISFLKKNKIYKKIVARFKDNKILFPYIEIDEDEKSKFVSWNNEKNNIEKIDVEKVKDKIITATKKNGKDNYYFDGYVDKEGKPYGFGTLHTLDGTKVLEGYFIDGKLDGRSKRYDYFDYGRIINYKNGKKDGFETQVFVPHKTYGVDRIDENVNRRIFWKDNEIGVIRDTRRVKEYHPGFDRIDSRSNLYYNNLKKEEYVNEFKRNTKPTKFAMECKDCVAVVKHRESDYSIGDVKYDAIIDCKKVFKEKENSSVGEIKEEQKHGFGVLKNKKLDSDGKKISLRVGFYDNKIDGYGKLSIKDIKNNKIEEVEGYFEEFEADKKTYVKVKTKEGDEITFTPDFKVKEKKAAGKNISSNKNNDSGVKYQIDENDKSNNESIDSDFFELSSFFETIKKLQDDIKNEINTEDLTDKIINIFSQRNKFNLNDNKYDLKLDDRVKNIEKSDEPKIYKKYDGLDNSWYNSHDFYRSKANKNSVIKYDLYKNGERTRLFFTIEFIRYNDGKVKGLSCFLGGIPYEKTETVSVIGKINDKTGILFRSEDKDEVRAGIVNNYFINRYNFTKEEFLNGLKNKNNKKIDKVVSKMEQIDDVNDKNEYNNLVSANDELERKEKEKENLDNLPEMRI